MNGIRLFIAVLSLCWQITAIANDSVKQASLVIVIDDVGNNYAEGEAILSLSGPVTYSFLPHTAHVDSLLKLAVDRGKEVMLHAPMANTRNKRLGPGALTEKMTETEFKAVLNNSLDSLPYAIGLNNHMGSLLTRKEKPMQWVMDIARERGLFFLDSRTTPGSVGWKVAKQRGVPHLKRDIFLDHYRDWEFMSKQFLRATRIARKHGSAVIIGHPYPSTTKFLKEAIPSLDEAGIKLVSASALILQENQHLRLAKVDKKDTAVK